ncbi:MAG: hypothetical protein M5U34_27935 [Chloroflexi bacterium]|nr:hypothetical protein [Chloroflexota bacterium]
MKIKLLLLVGLTVLLTPALSMAETAVSQPAFPKTPQVKTPPPSPSIQPKSSYKLAFPRKPPLPSMPSYPPGLPSEKRRKSNCALP